LKVIKFKNEFYFNNLLIVKKMNCLQRNKNGKQCSKSCIQTHTVYPGYCKFHITRFEANLDVPTPMNQDNPPPIPVLPEINPMEQDFNNLFVGAFNENIDVRLTMFLVEFQDEIVLPAIGRNIQDQDMLLFETIIGLPVEEQNFLITHYERLVELLQVEIRRIEVERAENRPLEPVRIHRRVVVQNNNVGVIERIFQALGFQGQGQLPQNVPNQNEGDLARFSKDTQNVHTSKMVEMVVETSKKLMKFSKNKKEELDTMAYCFTRCKLSDKARQQMALMYYSDVSIYNLKTPTYRLVMDGIWVYIDSQKEDLQKEIVERLAQELEDNVGMCAQGNLSRLVNVLSGYMPGVGFKNEKSLQDQMLELRDVKDVSERKSKAMKLCKEFKQTKEETDAWIDLLED
jgi:hypothetical protein